MTTKTALPNGNLAHLRIVRFCCFLLVGLIFVQCSEKRNLTAHKGPNQTEEIKPRRAELLFLGHASQHHDSRKYAPWLATALFNKGINLTYTENTENLNKENLANYDALLIYANHEYLAPDQEEALRGFLEEGKGLVPLHSATGCFKNSDWYIQTIGGQFASHGTGDFIGEIVMPDHTVMRELSSFETWDETYVHQRVNPDIQVLMERVEEGHREPYTWIRREGNGRVFYTAYGHDERTWQNLGFLRLLENGILWAMGDGVKASIAALEIPDVSIYDEPISDFTKRYEVPRIQEPLSPEESQKLIQKPVDFEISLFAAEPDIQNPIAMAWDERGRLWIVESVDYPNTFKETDGQANDRIKICEDTDGDGKADKFTIFAEGLNIPTSIAFANGGVIVSMAPDFVFLKDTDGDDKADVRETIMTGWGKNDTHAGPSNLQYGFDNKIWGVTGYSGFDGVIDGERLAFPQGVYHFDPDGRNFEYLGSTSNNTWGLGFSEDNNVFISTANNTHAAYFSIPARHLQRAFPAPSEGQSAPPFSIQSVQKIDGHYDAHAMTPNLRQVDVVGGFTSAAGFKLYTARDYPKAYWNRIAFVNEPTIRLIHNAIIEPEGAGFKEADGWNLLASSDEWFGPVHAEVGPDGAVWVADWYNFIIQHNVFVERQAPSRMVLPFTEQPHGQGNAFHSELRDTNHGRIYRVTYKNAKPYQPLALSKSDPEGLVAALKSDNMFWRMTAQRLLVESGHSSVIPSLFEIIRDLSTDEIGLNSPAVHAIWTLHGLKQLNNSNTEAFDVVTKALSHPATGVRKAAVSTLPKTKESVEAIRKSGITNDIDLNVRMHALLSLIGMPRLDAIGEMLYKASLTKENETDDWLSKAVFAAAADHKGAFVLASDKGKGTKSDLWNRVMAGISSERYELGRRVFLQYRTDVVDRELAISAEISGRGGEKPTGVILAHGDGNNGYVFFLQDGRLNFSVVQDGKTTLVQSPSELQLPERFQTQAQVNSDGILSISVDGEVVATKQGSGLFKRELLPHVRTGRDLGKDSNVAEYPDEFAFEGNLQQIVLEIK